MSLTLISGPKEEIHSLEYSYYSAAHSKNVYVYRRKDFAITAGANNGGKLQITISSTTGMSAGDLVYAYLDNVSYDDGVYEIDSVDTADKITLDLTWVSSPGASAFINHDGVRENYHVYVEIDVEGADNYEEANFTPDPVGVLEIDVMAWVRKYLSFDLSLDGSGTVNYRDENICKTFRIRTTEKWQGSSESASSWGDYYWAVKAVRQLHHEHEGNMGHYVLMEGLDTLFMTMFNRPRYFRGMPWFYINFIYSENVDTETLYRDIKEYDINGSEVSTDWDALQATSTEKDFVNVLAIPTPHASAKTVNVGIWHAGSKSITSFTNNGLGCRNAWDTWSSTGATVNSAITTVAQRSATSNSLGSFKVGDKIKFSMVINSGGSETGSVIGWLINGSCEDCSGENWYIGLGIYEKEFTVTKAGTLYLEIIATGTSDTLTDVTFSIDYYYTPLSNLETLVIEVEDECEENAVHLMWRNSIGGLDWWRFNHHQEFNLETSEIQLVEKPVDSLYTEDRRQVVDKQVRETMMLGVEGIPVTEIEAFKELLISPWVRRFYNDAPVQHENVIVVENSWKLYRNDEETFNLEFEIELPKRYTVPQW